MMQRIELLRQPDGVCLLVETQECVWSMRLLDHGRLLVEVESSDARLKHGGPRVAQLVRSLSPAGESFVGAIVKGWMFVLQFADCQWVSTPVVSASITGQGWRFEAIEQA